MDLLINIFNTILYRPLFNALILLYQYLPGHDFGVAIIVLTIIIRLLLYPSSVQSIKSQKVLKELQPKIREIQEKYKNDKEKQTKEIIELYKNKKINPFSGCLPLLFQLPVLIALYRVFWRGLQQGQLSNLYNFVSFSGSIDPTFLGVLNLTQPSIGLAVIAGVVQFFQAKMLAPQDKISKPKDRDAQFSGIIQKQMLYFFPAFTVLILCKFPSAIAVYWTVTALFSIAQQYFILKNHGIRKSMNKM